MGTSPREAVVKTGDFVEGRYRIIKTLGEGGMGTVFLAEHALIKRKVAIKILHPELATDANVIERFMNEARAAGTLGHPNIVESTDMGFTNDHVPYIVFEFLEGSLLTDEIYRVGGLPVRRAAKIAVQIASALHAAHRAGIVHRDLKSDNVFLTDKDDSLDHVKVLDFGISRFMEIDERQRGLVMGTPEFMAPEQITNPDNVDGRADIYALGVILYEMLTARRPFSNDDDPRQLLHRIVNEPPPPLMRPEVPHGLVDMIMSKMLAKAPEQRYPKMNDVEAALEAFMTRGDGTPVPRRRTQPVPKIDDDFAHDPTVIPARAKMLATPWPGQVETLDTPKISMDQVALAQAPAKRPYLMYGIAGVGMAIGALGLVVGLRSGRGEQTAMKPQPVPQPQPQPAAATQVPREPQKIQVQLEADAPNAHVVFRRRVSATPATMQIAATDVVELIEVSAPGYKSTRYWLTFDRPTHLKAHLVKGAGSSEASEEDTLVALGEVAAPAIAAAAPAETPAAETPAAAPVAVAKTTEKPASRHRRSETKAAEVQPATQVAEARTAPVMAPRKIGRAAAEATPSAPKPEVAMATATPAPAEPVAKVEEPKPVAKVEEPKPEPVAAKVEMPKPEPAVAKPEVLDAPKPAFDNATVSSVVSTHRPEVLKCFADGKKKDHTMKGTLSLQLQVDAGGKVHRVQVQSTLNNPLVAACVVKAANTWQFPSRAGGDFATVTYPFTLN